ncbi:MAG TPA: hypothetical protein VHM92_12285 [Allosphingosinicella sp.]|nr:hypothetical protein [Allosphingosinicella sp.]
METLLMASLIAAQIGLATQPAAAAELVGARGTDSQREGAFLGARVRLRLGGENAEPVRAALTLAPLQQWRGLDGSVRTRFGEGFELGVGDKGKPALSLAGQRVDRLMLGRSGQAPEGRKQGVSDLGWVAIGIGAVVVIVLALAVACTNDDDCIGSE